MTKKMSTPTNPAGSRSGKAWNRTTAATATALKPSMSGRYLVTPEISAQIRKGRVGSLSLLDDDRAVAARTQGQAEMCDVVGIAAAPIELRDRLGRVLEENGARPCLSGL